MVCLTVASPHSSVSPSGPIDRGARVRDLPSIKRREIEAFLMVNMSPTYTWKVLAREMGFRSVPGSGESLGSRLGPTCSSPSGWPSASRMSLARPQGTYIH
jgi:hypothetical protein